MLISPCNIKSGEVSDAPRKTMDEIVVLGIVQPLRNVFLMKRQSFHGRDWVGIGNQQIGTSLQALWKGDKIQQKTFCNVWMIPSSASQADDCVRVKKANEGSLSLLLPLLGPVFSQKTAKSENESANILVILNSILDFLSSGERTR